MKNQILKNLFSNYGVNLVSMAVGFALVPFLIVKLGLEAYGVVVLAEAAIAFFEIGTLSVRIALSRHASFALARGDRASFEEYLSTGRVLLGAAALGVLVIGFTASAYFDELFRVPAGLETQSRLLFGLLITAFALTVSNVVHWSVLYAKERFDLINGSLSAGLAVRAAGIFAAFSFLPAEHRTLPVYGLIYLAMSLTQNALVWYWRGAIMPSLKIGARFDRDKAKEIFSMGGHTSLSRLNALLYDTTANIVINIVWGPSANAVYSVSLKVPQILKRFFMDTTWTLTPTFTNLAARHDKRRFEHLFFVYTKMVSIVTMPLCLALMFLSEPLVKLWVGPSFDDAGRLMPLHLLPLLVGIPLSVCGCVTNAYNRVSVPSRVGFIAALFNVALGLALGVWKGYWLYGMAAASSITLFLYLAIFTPYYACRVAGLPFGRYIVDAWLKPFAWALTFIAAPLGVARRMGWETQPLLAWLGFGAVILAAYGAAVFRFVLSADEKRKFYETAGRFVPSAKQGASASEAMLPKLGNK